MNESDSSLSLKINEFFYSIQGESSFTGAATSFIRTTGCPLRCNYCDTQYAYTEGSYYTIQEIIEKVKFFGASYVCVTGGEPLSQKNTIPLLKKLCSLGYTVSIETSGNISIKNIDLQAKIVLDIKTPDSGAPHSFLEENLSFINMRLLNGSNNHEFKFVICSYNDFLWAEDYCRLHSLFSKGTVYFSPSVPLISSQWLAELILLNKSSARLHLQIHKYIWPEKTRGV